MSALCSVTHVVAQHGVFECLDGEMEAARAAESDCKTNNGCSACSDFDFGDDCDSNEQEHCEEIECCPECEDEIHMMWVCEHGDTCHEHLSCGDEHGHLHFDAFEWAGIFSVADDTHTWSMQSVDGAYADATMRL
eukprot:SAG31_NODE_6523_length_1988_cov_2.642668_1_plen_134_part_10